MFICTKENKLIAISFLRELYISPLLIQINYECGTCNNNKTLIYTGITCPYSIIVRDSDRMIVGFTTT